MKIQTLMNVLTLNDQKVGKNDATYPSFPVSVLLWYIKGSQVLISVISGHILHYVQSIASE